MLINLLDSLENLHLVSVFLSGLDESLDIFGETTATISTSWIKEFPSDASIRSDTSSDHLHISPNNLTKVGNIIHETDAGSQHGVGSILDHLSGRNICEYHTEIVEHEWPVQPHHQRACSFRLHANNHTVGTHEILDGRTLFEKLGIGRHVERNLLSTFFQFLLDGSLHFHGRSNGNGGFCHQDGIFFDILSELSCHIQHILKISRPILIGRSTHSAENQCHIIDDILETCCERQSALVGISFHHFIQSRLINGDFAIFEVFYLFLVNVHAGDMDTHFCEACSANQANIACSNYCNIHYLGIKTIYTNRHCNQTENAVLSAKDDFVDRQFPVYIEVRVIPCDASLTLRMVELIAFVLENHLI